MPFALQLDVCVVNKLSVIVPLNVVGFCTPVQESGQLNLKHTLKLMALVLVQAERLLIVIVNWPAILVMLIQGGNTAAQAGS